MFRIFPQNRPSSMEMGIEMIIASTMPGIPMICQSDTRIRPISPAIAPSVGNPTPGGLLVHEMESILKTLAHKNIVGLDVVETASDRLGDVTAVVASKIIYDFLTLME